MSFLRYSLIVIIVFLLSLSGSLGYLIYTVVEMDGLPEGQSSLTTRIYDCNDNLIGIRYIENRIEVPLDLISSHLIAATVAVEDRRYYQHYGFDLSGVGRALLNNIKNRQTAQGGSTISQQLAKNLYLTHDRTLQRKVQEAVYTIHLERRYSKDEILEMYLNTIYYGHSAYGIEAAALTYFGKNAADLTLAESALLAGLPRGPFYYSPFINEEAAIARQVTVLNQMFDTETISEAEKEAALSETLVFREPAPEEAAAYFLDHVINVELARLFNWDLTPVYKGGLEIYTTLDPAMQQAAQAIVAGIPEMRLDDDGKRQPQAALVAMEPSTGYVRAMVGGRDYNETPLNRVLSPRSPGSSFKPFLYAAALENGFTAADRILCEPISLDEPGTDIYEPTDYGGGFHNRELTIREALAVSCNLTAIKTHIDIGREKAAEMAARLGISADLHNFYSLPLGTVEVSLLELTAAFASFANGGYKIEPIVIRKVVDAQGRILLNNQPSLEKVLDERVAFLITDMLEDVLREGGTASLAASILNRTAAGKSGTSEHSKNAHMVGYTPDLVAGLYIGDDHEEPPGVSGGRLAAPLWAQFMEQVLVNHLEREFIVPNGIVQVDLCPETGLLRSPYCEGPAWEEYFIAGTEPGERCLECNPSFLLPPWIFDRRPGLETP